MEQNNTFEVLNDINVNDFTEVKDNGYSKLTYLSWAKAWETVKHKFPEATYQIEKFGEKHLPYVYDESTGYMVFTTVTINELTHEMWLPVMNGSNKAMKAKPYTYTVGKGTKQTEKTVEAATMFDINTSIMRCLTKNLAMFGLGLYIYSGEDIPNVVKDKLDPIDKAHIATLQKEMERTGVSERKLFYAMGVKSWEEATIREFKIAMDLFANTPDKKG